MSSALTIGSIGLIIGLIVVFFVVVIAAIAIFFIVVYNGLVRARQKVRNAWSQIDVQLQRRFDLIPNLVECVKGYMAHEEGTLQKITELRTSWANAQTINEKAKLEGELSTTLKTIMAVSENYPDLKANQNFLSLQNDLKDTENKISYARQFYNDTVTMYNTSLEVFPKNFVGSMFKFKPEALFEVQSSEVKNNVKVDFNK
ncbi:MAG: LemA family protein [Clostridia bacterium]|nr:LemA family protein [Clostridia bacterium]